MNGVARLPDLGHGPMEVVVVADGYELRKETFLRWYCKESGTNLKFRFVIVVSFYEHETLVLI